VAAALNSANASAETEAMSQVSRPFQIALAAVLLFAVAWFAVLKHHAETSSSSSGSTPAISSPSSKASSSGASAQERAAETPTHVYKGAVPGLEGLTRDVRKAHEAVGKVQRQSREAASASVEGTAASRKSGSASAEGHHKGRESSSRAAGATAGANRSTGTSSSKAVGAAKTSNGSNAGSHPASTTTAGSPAKRVAAQLAEGRTVLVLFWNPHASADGAVHEQVLLVGRKLGHAVAIDFAKADEVGAFGTVTREVTINETPTLLLINREGLVSTIVGLTDAFAIEQAIREAAPSKR
jgi:hypothetical protein